MLQKLRTMRKDEGFTLIELLIVIIVLGILAAIVVFAVGTATKDAKTNACKADVKTVNVALEAYKAKNGVYPAADITSSANAAPLTGSASGGPFLKTWPTSSDYNIKFDTSSSAVWAAPGATTPTASTACPT